MAAHYDAASIAAHYGITRPSGGRWQGQPTFRIPCPSPDHGGDGDKNCAIADGEQPGWIRAKCHSGRCSWKSIMAGLQAAGAMPDRTWHYDSGYTVTRINKPDGKKDFKQATGSRNGELIFSGNRDSGQIVFVEGETTHEAVLSAIGERVTVGSWRGGAGSHQHLQLADLELVNGKIILLWADNDEDGIEAMRHVAGLCWAAGACDVLHLPCVGQPDSKADAADIPLKAIVEHYDGGKATRDDQGPVNLASIEPVKPEWLVQPLILKNDVSFLSGPGGSAKTRFGLNLLHHCATGGQLMGHPGLTVPKLGPGCLITGGEELRGTLAYMHPGCEAYTMDATAEWTKPDGALGAQAKWQLELCINRGYSVVVLDSISNLFFGNENVRRDVNLFIRGLREYAYRGLSIVLIGHTSRQHSDWSGSTGWQTGPRSHVTLSKHEDNDDVTVITLAKANRAKAGAEWLVTNHDEGSDNGFGPWRMAPAWMLDGSDEASAGDGESTGMDTLLTALSRCDVPTWGGDGPMPESVSVTVGTLTEAQGKAGRSANEHTRKLITEAEAAGRLHVKRQGNRASGFVLAG